MANIGYSKGHSPTQKTPCWLCQQGLKVKLFYSLLSEFTGLELAAFIER